MTYVKTTWENLPSEVTPINASNLNNIEDGVENNDSLIAKQTVTSAVASVLFTGLDINADGGVYDIVVQGAQNTSSNGFEMFVNGDAVSTNYNSSFSLGSAVQTLQNNGLIGFMEIDKALNIITLSLNDDVASASQEGQRTALGDMMQCAWTKIAAVSNITTIEVMMTGARTFNVGTVVKIYKRGQ